MGWTFYTLVDFYGLNTFKIPVKSNTNEYKAGEKNDNCFTWITI